MPELHIPTPRTDTDTPDTTPEVRDAEVEYIIDGDTFALTDGTSVRLIGIDAPESTGPTAADCHGSESTKVMSQLVANGSTVRLELGEQPTDHYGRTLAYVWLADGRFLNAELVARGAAQATPFPPNVTHDAALAAAETHARDNAVGLWAMCDPA